jgi:hypothetical protein
MMEKKRKVLGCTVLTCGLNLVPCADNQQHMVGIDGRSGAVVPLRSVCGRRDGKHESSRRACNPVLPVVSPLSSSASITRSSRKERQASPLP